MYCSWRTDPKSQCNAFQVDWSKSQNWLNHPWDIIAKALWKLQQDRATALCCLPVWRTAPWWYKLTRMMTSRPTIISGQPLYQDPNGKDMPAPRWATLFATLDGKRIPH